MAVYKEEKANTWRVIYRYTDWTGEKKQTQKRGFKTKREAQAWEREQLHKSTADLDMTFESFFEQYAADMQTRIKENTWATKEHIIRTKLMTELYQTSYKSRPPIIDGLLYSGAYILAGAPKIGKSFLVAQIAYHVSTGEKLWDYEVHQGSVLYLALEDDYQRIQSRMFMMYGVEDSDKLHFATAANKIGNGLDEQLDFFIGEHPDTKLIIIDTMQKIREVGGEAYSYASDYEIIGKLKGICPDGALYRIVRTQCSAHVHIYDHRGNGTHHQRSRSRSLLYLDRPLF